MSKPAFAIVCRFSQLPDGCRDGDSCRFRHADRDRKRSQKPKGPAKAAPASRASDPNAGKSPQQGGNGPTDSQKPKGPSKANKPNSATKKQPSSAAVPNAGKSPQQGAKGKGAAKLAPKKNSNLSKGTVKGDAPKKSEKKPKTPGLLVLKPPTETKTTTSSSKLPKNTLGYPMGKPLSMQANSSKAIKKLASEAPSVELHNVWKSHQLEKLNASTMHNLRRLSFTAQEGQTPSDVFPLFEALCGHPLISYLDVSGNYLLTDDSPEDHLQVMFDLLGAGEPAKCAPQLRALGIADGSVSSAQHFVGMLYVISDSTTLTKVNMAGNLELIDDGAFDQLVGGVACRVLFMRALSGLLRENSRLVELDILCAEPPEWASQHSVLSLTQQVLQSSVPLESSLVFCSRFDGASSLEAVSIILTMLNK